MRLRLWLVLALVLACLAVGLLGSSTSVAAASCADFDINNAQAAYLIACALAGGDANVPAGPATATFSDVPTDYWAFKYVEYAKATGVVSGYPDGTYRPAATVTRDRMAMFLARAIAGGDASVPAGPVTPTFSDVPTTHWAYRYVEYLYAQGVDLAYSTSPMTFAPSLPMLALTAGLWLDQAMASTGVVDVCAMRMTDFSADTTSGVAPLTVTFTDLSRGDFTSWHWDFGDGGTAAVQNPSHEYATAGAFTVTLTTFAGSDGPDTRTKMDYISVICIVPEAAFSGMPMGGPVPLTVDFTDLSTNDPTSWVWDFGDGGTSFEQNPSHAYDGAGIYTVSLTAANVGGSDTETKPGYIRVVFVDAGEDNWAIDYILACVQAGIVGGYWDGTYRPTLAVTRDQMAVYIARALEGGDANVPPGPLSPSYGDVPTDHWAYKYVEYARYWGVVGGYPDGTYKPDLEVDRGQMAVYVARAMAGGDGNVPDDPDGTPFFPDVPSSYWAYKYVEYCHDQGVVSGYWDGYHPEETVNRAQMAVYVARAFLAPTIAPPAAPVYLMEKAQVLAGLRAVGREASPVQ